MRIFTLAEYAKQNNLSVIEAHIQIQNLAYLGEVFILKHGIYRWKDNG